MSRSCTNPRPAYGGDNCYGISRMEQSCYRLPGTHVLCCLQLLFNSALVALSFPSHIYDHVKLQMSQQVYNIIGIHYILSCGLRQMTLMHVMPICRIIYCGRHQCDQLPKPCRLIVHATLSGHIPQPAKFHSLSSHLVECSAT